MIDAEAYLEIIDHAYMKGKIQGAIISYKVGLISAIKALGQIEEIVKKEKEDDPKNTR